ncbi:MAG: acyl-CoA thioesterase [Acidobacteria bacterium]|nr:acyl-CoA thioesterase [Acidobacteriota bacterium]
MKFSHSFHVAGADIDEQGHVNNVAYVRWIQDVAVAHWFAVTDEALREKYTWVVLRHEIDYKKQGFENDAVTATTWVGEPTRISWERFTEIRRGHELLVKARSVWCLIDRRTTKPSRITSDLIDLLF